MQCSNLRRTIVPLVSMLGLGMTLGALAPAAGAQGKPMPQVVAYVPNWNDLTVFANKIDWARLTQINVAFENPMNDAGDLSFEPDDALLIEKAHAHHVKVSLSIGGGSASTDKVLSARYFALIGDSKRAAFVAKIAAYLDRHHFDGLDVDIEGPAINRDYGVFVHDLSRALKPKGKLLTAALSQGYGGDKVPASAFESLDFVNIMSYDKVGNWDRNKPGQHSSFDAAKQDVAYFVGRGLPRAKALLGVPFYGYGFGADFRDSEYPYAAIVAAHPGAETLDQTGSTIWYNGIPTIKAKARYVRDTGLAGVMIWSLDSDVPGEKSLLKAVQAGLSPTL